MFIAIVSIGYCMIVKSKWDSNYKVPETKEKDIEMQKILNEFEDLNMEVKLIEDDPLETPRDS